MRTKPIDVACALLALLALVAMLLTALAVRPHGASASRADCGDYSPPAAPARCFR